MTNTRKKLTFVFSIFSVVGCGFGLAFLVVASESSVGQGIGVWLLTWFLGSSPLIILIIFNIIFREEK